VFERARRRPALVRTAQVAVLALLVAAALFFEVQQNRSDDKIDTESGRTTALEAIVAQACNAANYAELQKRGIVAECRLAQQGNLPSAIPSSAIPAPNANPTKVPANVIPDNTHVSQPPFPFGTPDEVRAAVSDYFATHPLPLTASYRADLQRATARYLTDNPPKPGHTPTQRQVRQVVRAVLLANPPPPGPTGAPGTSVVKAALDGCNVVFTLSDGTTSSVGPLCGPQGDTGPGPTDQQVQQGIAAFCQANNQCQGPAGVVKVIDNCPAADPGNFVTNVDATYDATTETITLTCEQGNLAHGVG
jgi:hypothetical protein